MAEPNVLDRPWRIWASVAVIAILLTGVLLGAIVIPIVQGRGAGLDAYTAICRALGILPGSPARPQPFDRSPPSPVSQVSWTPEVLKVLARGDIERGRAKVMEVCVACHGEQGISTMPNVPHLNGQSAAAIYKQLHDYRTASRVNDQMTDVAKALDESVIADVAVYFAGQRKRNPNPLTLANPGPGIETLVDRGDPSRRMPPCGGCHRPSSGGPIETPILAEQGEDYLIQQMQMFASGQRRNDVYARMRTIAAGLTADEIKGLAAYYRAGFK